MDVDPQQYTAVQLREWLLTLGLRQSGNKAEMALRLNAVPPTQRGTPPVQSADNEEVDRTNNEIMAEPNNVPNENVVRVVEDVFLDAANEESNVVQRDVRLEAELDLVRRERDLLLREVNLLKKEATPSLVQLTNRVSNVDQTTEPLPLSIVKDMVPEFDGNANFDFWATQVRSVKSVYNLSDNALRAVVAAKFTGKAQKWLHANVNLATCGVEELFQLMKATFGSQSSKLIKRKQFEERKWKAGESFAEYFDDKNLLATNLNLDEDEMVDCLIEGIPNKQLRTQACMQCFNNKSQLLKAFAKLDLGTGVGSDTKERDGMKEVRCFNCNSIGHYANTCLKPKREFGACFGCGSLDHKIMDCPESKKSTTRKVENEYVRCLKYKFDCKTNSTVSLETLIDSGSPICFIRRSCLPNELINNFSNTNVTNFIGINKSNLISYGKIRCSVILKCASYRVNFYIVVDESMGYDVVLGRDFLRDSGSKLLLNFENMIDSKIVVANCEVLKNDSCELTNNEETFENIEKVMINPDETYRSELIKNYEMFENDRYKTIDLCKNDRLKLMKTNDSYNVMFQNENVEIDCHKMIENTVECETKNSVINKDENVTKNKIDKLLRDEFVNELMAICFDDANEPDIIIGNNVTINNKKKITEIFHEWYVKPERPQDPKVKCEMKILLNDTKPFSYHPRRISYAEKLELQKMIDEYIEKEIIRASESEYASPIVLIKKKTGELRLCVDFRKLNEITVKDNYPLPLIDDLLDRLAGKKIFTKLDLKNGFFHVFMNLESVKLTSFVSPLGQFEFLRMPFGLKNAPSTFQRFVNKIFSKMVSEDKVIVYMDDVMIASENMQEHLEVLTEVFKRLVDNNLELRLDKCEFAQSDVKYLGYRISGQGIKADEKGLQAIHNFPVPNKTKAVQSFLGLCSYFRRFVKNFSVLAKPLYDLTRKNAQFKFGTNELKCFELLKNKLIEAPILSIFNPTHETELHCDASSLGFGAILLQRKEDSKFHPIFYFSKRTTEIESKYHSFELETLAIVYALKRFRIYLMGRQFKIVTDCNSLALTLNKKELNPRIARWALELQNYDYKLEHRKNERMQHVDALSRCSNVMILETNSFEENLIICQNRDEKVKKLVNILQNSENKFYEMRNGVIYKKTEGDRLLFYVPENMEKQVIFKFHDEMGHVGIDKVIELIGKSYWFPKARSKVADHISNCLKCIAFSSKNGREEGFLHVIPKGDKPFEVVHIDHYGPIDQSVKEKKHLLVVIDAFTKFVRLYSTKTTKTKEVVNALADYFRAYSCPKMIISDRGSCFTSVEFEEFIKKHHVKHVKVATGSPQANGQVERVNRTIGPMMSKMIKDGKPWTSVVQSVEFTLNNTVHRSINQHPSVMLFGVDQKGLGTDAMQEKFLELNINKGKLSIKRVRALAKIKQQKLQLYNKKYVDKKRLKPHVYEVGDYVMIKNFDSHVGAARKLIPKFKGPYKVAKILRNDRYLLKDVDGFQQSQIPYLGVWAVGNIRPWITSQCKSKIKNNNHGRSGDLAVRTAEL